MIYPWTLYSKKIGEKIERLRCAGSFTEEDAKARGMRLVVGKQGLVEDGNAIALYWLVDESDGVIADARYRLFGQSALIAAAEGACTLLIGKNYDQARRISADLIDKELRDHPDAPAFPPETLPHVNLVLDAIDDAIEQCLDLPLPETYVSPVPSIEGEGYPGFETLSKEKQLAVIEQVLTDEVRPYIELDAGGIEVLDFSEEKELKIAYQGACTSCFSAIGATLSTIQQIIQAKIHPEITVVPDMETLTF